MPAGVSDTSDIPNAVSGECSALLAAILAKQDTRRKRKSRREDDRLLTGNGRFTADWNLPGQAHATFVRADRAHAKLLAASRPASA